MGEAVAHLRRRRQAVGDLPAEKPLLERQPDELVHVLPEALEGLEDVERRIAWVDVEPHLDSRARLGGVETQPEVGMERVGRRVEDLDRVAGPRRPLDADRRGLPEFDREPILVRERRLDDLALYLAV